MEKIHIKTKLNFQLFISIWKNWTQRYRDFWLKTNNYHEQMRLLEVDFDKSIWYIIWQQKIMFVLVQLAQILHHGSWVFLPFLIAYSFENNNLSLFLLIIIGRILVNVINTMIFYVNPILQLQTIHSVANSANKFFLTNDLIYHSQKSSGQILSKVRRGSENYEDLLDLLTFEFVPIVINFLSVSFIFYGFGFSLGTWVVFIMLLFLILSFAFEYLNFSSFKKKIINIEDEVSDLEVENLKEIFLIRSSFATPEQLKKFELKTKKLMKERGSSWFAGNFFDSIMQIVFMIGVGIIGVLIFADLKNGQITAIDSATLISTFLLGTSYFLSAGQAIKSFIRHYLEIQDLYQFIQKFGKPSFPVVK